MDVSTKAVIAAAASGDEDAFKGVLAAKGDASCQDSDTGLSPLMAAAAAGHGMIVSLLLQEGVPWNAIDRFGDCAGNYALKAGHQVVVDQLVQAGVTAELIFAALEKKKAVSDTKRNVFQTDYLKRGVVDIAGDKILDEEGDAVMMEWERPLMQEHADLLCGPKSGHGPGNCAILNIGFGMGIFDSYVQSHRPKIHTIVEAHPAIQKKMLAASWHKKKGVRLVMSRWQDAIPELLKTKFDGIFFDTYGEDWSEQRRFHALLPKLLKPGGLYSFFNGFCPDNIFFQGVACQVVQTELMQMGISSEFLPLDISACFTRKENPSQPREPAACAESQPQPDQSPTKRQKTESAESAKVASKSATAPAEWEGVKRIYFHDNIYYLPLCRLPKSAPKCTPDAVTNVPASDTEAVAATTTTVTEITS